MKRGLWQTRGGRFIQGGGGTRFVLERGGGCFFHVLISVLKIVCGWGKFGMKFPMKFPEQPSCLGR